MIDEDYEYYGRVMDKISNLLDELPVLVAIGMLDLIKSDVINNFVEFRDE